MSTLKICAYLVARHLFNPFNPHLPGSRTEHFFRYAGFFQAATPAEVFAQYLRGFVLFGRESSKDAWFHWYYAPVRAIITPETAHVPKRMRKLLRDGEFEVRCNQDAALIVRHCQDERRGWLTPQAVELYLEMHTMGLVTTVGTYREGKLVGGLWGLTFGRVFTIMSMFHLENHAGALACAALAQTVADRGRWTTVDFGNPGANWERFGIKVVSLHEFAGRVMDSLFEMRQPEQAFSIPECHDRQRSAGPIGVPGRFPASNARPASPCGSEDRRPPVFVQKNNIG